MDGRFSLRGHVALVTGANGALGSHFAHMLHEAGASVLFAVRRPESVARDIETLGARVAAIEMDVLDEASVTRGFSAATERLGLPDIIVNNAGIAVSKRFVDQDVADWDTVFGVNLRGAFLVGREAARRLSVAGQPGSIVNIGSILGERVVAGVAPYEASKAGLAHLTRAMAVELARDRIRVNALAPGYVATDFNTDFIASEHGRAMVRRIPQRRLCTPDDLTGPLLLLASEAGAHMTGTVLVVDGGHSIAPI